MKTSSKVIALMFGAFVVLAATVGPNPQWTAYTYGFTTNTTAASARTYLGVTASTNTSTLTGTNGVYFRPLYTAPTNLFFSTIATNATSATYTNNGDFTACTSLLNVTLPALLGSNSTVFAYIIAETTNANTSAATLACYAGSNTNFFYDNTGFKASTVSEQAWAFIAQSRLFQNAASFTNQQANHINTSTFVPGQTGWGRTNIVDTSVPWKLYLGLTSPANHTNLHVTGLTIYEMVKN